MELFVDRFATVGNRPTVDLATGADVWTRVLSGEAAGDAVRWAGRCETLHRLHHRSIARLVDYGAFGAAQRFEAWGCGGVWRGARAQAEAALRAASRFLSGSGLTQGSIDIGHVRTSPSGPVVWLDGDAGYPDDAAPGGAETLSIAECGLEIQGRAATSALIEVIELLADAMPRVVALWGSRGAGLSTIMGDVARAARLHGFVPLSVAWLDRGSGPLGPREADALAEALRGRSLVLLDDDPGERLSGRRGWSALLEATLRTPRAHVLVFAGRGEVRSVDGFAIDSLPPSVLASAVRPVGVCAAIERRVARAAAASGGRPGRFARLLWPIGAGQAASAACAESPPVAAERGAAYSFEAVDEALAPPPGRRSWPAPGELASLRRRLEQAERLLADGRHARGERMLRQAICSLARRDDWMDAGRGALRLSAFLIRRGRVRDALKLLDEARSYWTRVGETVGMIDVATLTGVARTDLAVLDEAESALGAALAAARAHADVARVASASLALARVRFWRGQYADAAALLASVDAESLSSEESIRRQVLVSRTAVGMHDPGRAVTEAVGALDLARSLERPALVGEAACALAFAHLSVGDFEAVDRDVALGVAAARAARDPLRGVRCRLLLAERARRGGQRSTAAMLVSRFEKIAASAFPPILRARCALLRDLAVESPPVRECVGRHVAATGLNALELFAPAGRTQPTSAAAMLTDDMVEIVEICHTAETETTLLQEVCRRLRRQLRAAAVGFVGLDGSVCAPLATDGARVDVGVAERTIASGMSVPPHRVADRLEAAAPVRYGGVTLGAVVARWTLGTADCSANGAMALALAATAAAPAVAAALDGRRRPPGTSGADLIGVSAAIGEVRRAVERAAAAPFSVLIEGESGSGKELVARALHRGGVRRDRRFCSVNCAALPDDLVESELFGHVRGAFTGAAADRPGVFEEAHGGTLFLDEISELSARAQAKLLRVVQDGELRRVGENVSRRVDVRVVSATNRALRGEVTGGRFRLDLLYRLDVIRIIVPPLRDRREDVPMLADHFWREVTARVGSRATLAASAVAALARYDWPGNVRELQNVLAALVVRAPKRGVVPPTALPPQFGLAARDDACRLDEARRTFEARFVRAALVRTGGHRTHAAAELGVTRQGLTKLMARLGIESQ